jgi:hypothetical protein
MIKGLGFAVVISTMAMGCGGGSGSSNGSGFTPSESASTPLNKLSTAQATQLCEQTGTYFNSTLAAEANSKTFGCQVAGNEVAALSFDPTTSTNATVQKACQDAYDACLKEPVDAGADDVDAGTFTTDCTTTQADLATCTATVGQYTACVDELNSAFTNAFPPCAQLTVAKLTPADSDAGTDPFASGPACAALNTACPGATGDTSMTTSMLSATKSALKATRK